MQVDNIQGAQHYPSHIRWDMRLDDDFTLEKTLSKRTIRDIQFSIKKMQAARYIFSLEPVDLVFIQKFFPIYEKTVSSVQGTVDDVIKVMKTDQIAAGTYQSLSLYREDELIGATIFHYTPEKLFSLYYRGLPREINVKIPAGLSHVSDYLLVKRATELGALIIRCGRDLNPFGIPPHPNIGLALYKLRMGYCPSATSQASFDRLDSLISSRNALVLLAENNNQAVTRAIWLTSTPEKSLAQYKNLLYSRGIEVSVHNLPLVTQS